MDSALITLLIVAAAWQVSRMRRQRARIALLGQHLSNLQLERHMETLTRGYTRAIHEETEARQLQVLGTFAQAERSVAAQVESLADAMQKESAQSACMSTLSFFVPYAERLFPSTRRDFRDLLHIHAAGLRHVVDNADRRDAKSRAYRLSAELYLLQHSCHWFCKSRAVANARLVVRHQVQHRKVLESVSAVTRSAYLRWLQGAGDR